jgi:hypothetical protein
MKKITVAITALASIGIFAPCAGAEAVYSENIVGYTKVTLEGDNFNMLSAAFVPVGGGVGKKIVDVFTDNSQFTAGYAATQADYINIWNGGGYETYFFSAFINSWASTQNMFNETDETIPSVGGFWLYRVNDNLPVTLAGEVITTNMTVSSIAADNFNMIANPFAAPLPIKTIGIAAGSFTAGYAATQADYINVWNGNGYDTYFFSAFVNKWASTQDMFNETDASIPAGGSFWLYSLGTATSITLPVPYSVE